MGKGITKGYKILILLLTGPLMFATAVLFLPGSVFSFAASAAIGTIIWMGSRWAALWPASSNTSELEAIVICAIKSPGCIETSNYYLYNIILDSGHYRKY